MNRRDFMKQGSLVILSTMLVDKSAHADYTTSANPNSILTSWDGWGCSLAWWAKEWGLSSIANTLADMIYTTEWVNWNGTQVPGLGFNIVRYNVGGVGGSVTNDSNGTQTGNFPASYGGSTELLSPNLIDAAAIQTYWLNWGSQDVNSSSWDWTRDAEQRNMMQLALARGANLFEFFSNSPPWWMCYNSSSQGSNSSGADNLQSWNYNSFAYYLAAVAQYAKNNWGIPVSYIEPFNEPSSGWWNYPGSQEGCNMTISTQNQVLSALWSNLNSDGWPASITAADENTTSRSYQTWQDWSSSSINGLQKFNTHTYDGYFTQRANLRSLIGSMKLWCSEYGDNDSSGIQLAGTIMADVHQLNPQGWCYWQPLDGSGWGLIDASRASGWTGSPTRKYYVMAQFSRHLRPGFEILGGNDNNTIYAYSTAESKLVVITFNWGNGQWVNYDLSQFASVKGPITRWSTTCTPGNGTPDILYQQYSDTSLSGTTFWTYMYAYEVTTFEVQNVTL